MDQRRRSKDTGSDKFLLRCLSFIRKIIVLVGYAASWALLYIQCARSDIRVASQVRLQVADKYVSKYLGL